MTKEQKKTDKLVQKFLDKETEINFLIENGLKRDSKKAKKMYKIQENYWNKFIETASKLTKEEYEELENIENLEFFYQDVIDEKSN